MIRTTIWCDGGCHGNGTADAKTYGSFKVEGETEIHRIKLQVLTNNEAEYATLVNALQYAHNHNIEEPRVRMDSRLVVEQVNGNYQVKAENLKSWLAAAKALMVATRATITWTGRDELVRVLGH